MLLEVGPPHLLEDLELPAPAHERHVAARPHDLGLAQRDGVVALRHLQQPQQQQQYQLSSAQPRVPGCLPACLLLHPPGCCCCCCCYPRTSSTAAR